MKDFLCFLLFFILLQQQCHASKRIFVVGGIFEKDQEDLEDVFKLAFQKQNDRLLKHNRDYRFEVKTATISDAFTLHKKVCTWASEENGLTGLFGANSPALACVLESMAKTLWIPNMQLRYKPPGVCESDISLTKNFYPDVLPHVVVGALLRLGWNNVGFIYENSESLLKLEEVLKHNISTTTSKVSSDDDILPILEDFNDSGIKNVLVDCKVKTCERFLSQIKDFGPLNTTNYMFLNLDIHNAIKELALEKGMIKYRGNITTVSVISRRFPKNHMKAEAVFMNEAVDMFSKSIGDTDGSTKIKPTALTCNGSDFFKDGLTISVKVWRLILARSRKTIYLHFTNFSEANT